MNVNLTSELERMVLKKVESGRYNSASEVVREALRLMQERDEVRTLQLKELRRKINKGIGEADRGELVDGEQFMAGLLGEIDSRARKRKVG